MLTQRKITERQNRVLDFIVQFQAQHGSPPTVREVAAGINCKGLGTVHTVIRQLEASGKLKRTGQIRGFAVAQERAT